jgi:hypothetical protein
MLVHRIRRSRKGAQPWCGCTPPAWRSALSPVGFGEDGGTLITAGRLPALRAAVWLLPFLVSPHDMWDLAPAPEGSSSMETLPVTLGMRVGRAAFKKGSIPRAVDMPPHSPHVLRPSTFRAHGWGAPVSPSSCCCWRSATLRGLALFRHRSTSRIFITQLGCSPPPAVTQDDDCRPRGGEKQARLRPLPCPQLQGCSSSSLWRRAS